METNHINEFLEQERLKGLTEGTIKRKEKDIKAFSRYMKKNFNKASNEDVRQYIETYKEKRAACRNLVLSHLKQFYDYLLESGEILINPVKGIEREKKTAGNISGIFNEEEVKALLLSLSGKLRKRIEAVIKRDRAILEILYSTGVRASELVSLDIDDVDFRHGEIYISRGKGGKDRRVPAGEEALKALEEYLELRGRLSGNDETGAIFLSRQGKRISSISVRSMIYRRKLDAGIESKGSIHAFRHSFASHLLKHGASMASISAMLGHECVQTTQDYTKVSPGDMVGVYRNSHPRARKKRDSEEEEIQ